MKAIEFPEVNVRIAENQPQYETLPVHIDLEDPQTPTTMCIQLDPEEIKQVIETGRIWITTLTFMQQFHPIKMSFMKPEGMTEPELKTRVYLLDECDYIAATSVKEATEFYRKEVTDFDEAEEPEIKEIEESEWPNIKIRFPEDDDQFEGETKSLLDLMQEFKATIPYHIVSIEL